MWIIALSVIAAVVVPTTANVAYPNKIQDCSRCHGPSSGTYYDNIMTIAVSKTTLAPGEVYTVGIDIVIQTSLSKKDTGYAIEDLGTGTFVVWLDATAVQSHYDQSMTAPSAAGTYNYRVWGESGPATSDGMTDYDDYTIIVQAQANVAPTVTQLVNLTGYAGASFGFSASASDPDADPLGYTWNFGDGSALAVGNPVSHTYSTAGRYLFTVYVDDSHAHNVSSSAYASVAFNLNLVAGWNMVGVPLVGSGYKASTLGLRSGETVVGWDMATQSYKQNFVVGVSPPTFDFAINPGLGYWIYATSAETLHLYGTVATSMSVTITVPAGGGSALLSTASVRSWNASSVPSMFSVPSSVTTVSVYDGATLSYKTYISGVPFTNFALDPGRGYWVYFTGSGTLAYTP